MGTGRTIIARGTIFCRPGIAAASSAQPWRQPASAIGIGLAILVVILILRKFLD